MFDARIRPLIDPPLECCGPAAGSMGDQCECRHGPGFCPGHGRCRPDCAGRAARTGLAVIIISRIADGLDGAVARATRRHRTLAAFSTSCWTSSSTAPCRWLLQSSIPAECACQRRCLLLSYFANGTTFLAYAIMAEKRDLETEAQGVKSLYYMSGLAEGGETILAIVLFCLFPGLLSGYRLWLCRALLRLGRRPHSAGLAHARIRQAERMTWQSDAPAMYSIQARSRPAPVRCRSAGRSLIRVRPTGERAHHQCRVLRVVPASAAGGSWLPDA